MANRVFHVALLATLATGCGEDEPLGAVEVDAGVDHG